MQNLSIFPDRFGSSSLIRMPETFVSMAPYGPRISTGVSGFGSKVSYWLGPPFRKTKMQLVGPLPDEMLTEARAGVDIPSANVHPSQPTPPTVKRLRRLIPSHVRILPWPRESMGQITSRQVSTRRLARSYLPCFNRSSRSCLRIPNKSLFGWSLVSEG